MYLMVITGLLKQKYSYHCANFKLLLELVMVYLNYQFLINFSQFCHKSVTIVH